jgi:hypothetical protein
LNLRPPGYEPGELPDCSTPRRCPHSSSLVTLVPMWDWAIWSALAVGGSAGLAAIALLVRRILEAWRRLKAIRRHAADSLGELTAKAEQTAAKAEAAGDTAELQESVARLRVSVAQLAVLRAALDEARL